MAHHGPPWPTTTQCNRFWLATVGCSGSMQTRRPQDSTSPPRRGGGRAPKPDRRALELLAGCRAEAAARRSCVRTDSRSSRWSISCVPGSRLPRRARHGRPQGDGSRDGADHRRGPVSAGKGAAMSPQRRAVTDEAQRQRRRQNAGKRLKLCVAASGWRATR
jgi:hypothetical protein